jgi:hypothetical protein
MVLFLFFFFGESFAKIVGVFTPKKVFFWEKLINFQTGFAKFRVPTLVGCQTTTRLMKTKYHPTCPIAKSG